MAFLLIGKTTGSTQSKPTRFAQGLDGRKGRKEMLGKWGGGPGNLPEGGVKKNRKTSPQLKRGPRSPRSPRKKKRTPRPAAKSKTEK